MGINYKLWIAQTQLLFRQRVFKIVAQREHSGLVI